jgi:hypothetical protein
VIRWLAVAAVAVLGACKHEGKPSDGGAPDACAVLFGSPNAYTGLGADRCRPACACGGTVFAPPVYDAAFIQSLVDGARCAPSSKAQPRPRRGPTS